MPYAKAVLSEEQVQAAIMRLLSKQPASETTIKVYLDCEQAIAINQGIQRLMEEGRVVALEPYKGADTLLAKEPRDAARG